MSYLPELEALQERCPLIEYQIVTRENDLTRVVYHCHGDWSFRVTFSNALLADPKFNSTAIIVGNYQRKLP